MGCTCCVVILTILFIGENGKPEVIYAQHEMGIRVGDATPLARRNERRTLEAMIGTLVLIRADRLGGNTSALVCPID